MIELTIQDRKVSVPETCSNCMEQRETSEKLTEKQKQIRHKDQLLVLSEVGKLYKNSDFTKLEQRSGLFEPTIWTKRFVERIQSGGDEVSIILVGTTGNGKTELAACVNNKLVESGHNVLFTTLSMLFSKLGDFKNTKDYEIYQVLKTLDALIIDDLGIESFNSRRLEWLFNIIDTAVKYEIPLLITANYFDRKIFEIEKANKEDNMRSQRIFSRLIGKCQIIENKATDYRLKNR